MEPKRFNMDDVMSASFGESSSVIKASFKKTVNVRQYETEVSEAHTELNIDKPLNGIERMIVCGVLQSQLEYETYANMLVKGYVTESEFNRRKKSLEDEVNALCQKGRALLNKDVTYLFEIKPET